MRCVAHANQFACVPACARAIARVSRHCLFYLYAALVRRNFGEDLFTEKYDNQIQLKGNRIESNTIERQSNAIEFSKVFPFSTDSIGIRLIRSISIVQFQSFNYVQLLPIDSIIKFFDWLRLEHYIINYTPRWNDLTTVSTRNVIFLTSKNNWEIRQTVLRYRVRHTKMKEKYGGQSGVNMSGVQIQNLQSPIANTFSKNLLFTISISQCQKSMQS